MSMRAAFMGSTALSRCPSYGGFNWSYLDAATANECRAVAETVAGQGQRNATLNSAAFKLGQLVPGGLDEARAKARLLEAARSNGYVQKRGESAAVAVINSGIEAGKRLPRMPQHRATPRPSAVVVPIKPVATATPGEDQTTNPQFDAVATGYPDATNGARFIAGDDVPVQSGELRRHVYCSQDDERRPVRCKVKVDGRGFVDWYRVRLGDAIGWQPKKPGGYVSVPYVGGGAPFDAELMADELYWPEGEKDVDTLAGLGFAAFTFGGASDVPDVAANYARDRHIIILADNDERGAECAKRKAALVHPVALSVRIVSFDDVPEKGDVSDWIAGGKTAADLRALADATRLWQPPPLPPEPGLIIQSASDIEPEKIEWLWPGRVAIGKLTLFGGPPGLGKSQIHAFMCGAVSTGGAWPCGEGRAPLGNAIVFSAEDGVADTIVPRLIAAGADRSRIHIVSGVRDEHGRRTFSLKADIAELERHVRQVGDVRLIVIDPVSAYMGGVDGNGNTETRELLEPIADMAGRLRVAVVAITHLNKGNGGGGSVLNRFIGSIAMVAAARAAFAVIEDGDDTTKTRRLFLQAKLNIGKPTTGLAFRLEQELLPNDIVASRVWWEPSPVEVDLNAAFAATENAGGGDQPTSTDDVIAFLQTVLADGPVAVLDIEREAVVAGLLSEGKSIQCKAFRLARAALGIESVRVGGAGANGRWVWTTPKMPQTPKMPKMPLSGVGHLSGSEGHLSEMGGEQ
jgi:putative DNA primase/helicase